MIHPSNNFVANCFETSKVTVDCLVPIWNIRSLYRTTGRVFTLACRMVTEPTSSLIRFCDGFRNILNLINMEPTIASRIVLNRVVFLEASQMLAYNL